MASEQIENKKIYSAEELVWATQLAYCDFTELDIKNYGLSPKLGVTH